MSRPNAYLSYPSGHNLPVEADLHKTGAVEIDASGAQSLDRILAALPDELRDYLSQLAGAPRSASELAIGLLPFGYRVLLGSYGLIEESRPAGSAADDPRRRVELLEPGLHLIEAAAEPPDPIADPGELTARGDELRERYGAEPPFRAEESDS